MKIMKNLGIKVSQTEMPDKRFNDSLHSPYKYILQINRHLIHPLLLLPPKKNYSVKPLAGIHTNRLHQRSTSVCNTVVYPWHMYVIISFAERSVVR